ncbi:hypothetical protein ABIE21_002976 [Conyzicola nivalis]|uniref:Uncharacterized protein n=1 Tax=Conyzicola nivalis TaxID=1477021 RepID=A0ABV2QR75_9MICO
MGFFDRVFGRDSTLEDRPAPHRTADEIAVERYDYLLRTASPKTIDRVHEEAFAKLTPAQLDILFSRLTEAAPEGERPADATPAALAKAATLTEAKQPGALSRAFGGQDGAGWGGSMYGTLAGYVVASSIIDAYFFAGLTSTAVAQGAGADTAAASAAAGDGGWGGFDFGF